QFLHDFFVLRDPLNPENFIVDIAETLAGDFQKRLAVFRLRAKVTLETVDDGGLHVYAHPAEGLADPRLPALGRRFYTPEEPAETAEDASVYHDLRIALGIPDGGRTAQQQKDFPAYLNLDRLNAIAWDKGCFIG